MTPDVPENTQGGDTEVSADAWKEWNDYYYSLLGVEEKPSRNGDGVVKEGFFNKTKSLVGIANVFVDCGFQQQQDAEYDSDEALPEEGEEFSKEELAVMEKWPSNTYKWKDGKVGGKRVKVVPKQPAQEYAIFFDFPKIVIDWTKHPIEALHSLGEKPLRVSMNGYLKFKGFEGFGRRLAFDPNYKTKKISTKSPLYKLASNMDVVEEYIQSYNLAALAGKAVKFDVVMERNHYNDRDYFNTVIKNHSKITEVEAGDTTITVEQQIPQCDITPQAIPLNLKEGQTFDEAALGTVKHDKGLKAVLPAMVSWKPSPKNHPDFVKGIEFKDTDLYKALGWSEGTPETGSDKTSNQSGTNTKVDDKPSENDSDKKEQNLSEPVNDLPEFNDDFGDDEIPF